MIDIKNLRVIENLLRLQPTHQQGREGDGELAPVVAHQRGQGPPHDRSRQAQDRPCAWQPQGAELENHIHLLFCVICLLLSISLKKINNILIENSEKYFLYYFPRAIS